MPDGTGPSRSRWGSASKVAWFGMLCAYSWSGATACRGHVENERAGSTGTPAAIILDAGLCITDLNEESRQILERHCGRCHIGGTPIALSGALAVFDLREADWSARMRDRQLLNANWRLGEPTVPPGQPNDANDEERAIFKRFVDMKLEQRAQGRRALEALLH